jgi:predicted TIM-barrel fold metal-dependent hydrolase
MTAEKSLGMASFSFSQKKSGDLMRESEDSLGLLTRAKELGKEFPLFDFHVHPFDVLSGDTTYQAHSSMEGLFAKSSSAYKPPSIPQSLERSKERTTQRPGWNSVQAYILASRLAYTFTGRKVLADQLELIGFAGALLLPVAREAGVAERVLAAGRKMFADDKRFFIGCPIPVGLSPDQLLSFYEAAREESGIYAIKVHPNLAGLNPLMNSGRELIEATLVAAGRLGLPVVIHGGRTPGLEPCEMREFGTLCRLKEINWGLSSAPVIFAHCGCYGLAESEVSTALPILNSLFDLYPNLMADTSNLEVPVLRFILGQVDCNRLVFGSDALYVPIWKSWLGFLQAIYEVSNQPENDVIRIASLNAQYCLGLLRENINEKQPY